MSETFRSSTGQILIGFWMTLKVVIQVCLFFKTTLKWPTYSCPLCVIQQDSLKLSWNFKISTLLISCRQTILCSCRHDDHYILQYRNSSPPKRSKSSQTFAICQRSENEGRSLNVQEIRRTYPTSRDRAEYKPENKPI